MTHATPRAALLREVDAGMPALADLFALIGRETADPVIGISRDAFGAKETLCADLLAEFARGQGLEAGYDRAGNLAITAPGCMALAPEVLLASHVDSVPRGGNYDGLAGVIAGIGTLGALLRSGTATRPPVRVLGFRGEESPWFGTAYLGSKLFLGQLDAAACAHLRRFDTGLSLAEHMRALGLETPRQGPVVPLDRLRAYLELHIEQGPLLTELGLPVGRARAIRGNIRHPFARCLGRTAHSAAVPRHLRADALIAAARLIATADERWRALIEAGHDDLVFTCGIFHTDPAEHAMTKVPGAITFTPNIGATSDAAMAALQATLDARAAELAAEHGVRFDFGERVGTPAVPLDAGLGGLIDTAAAAIGIRPHVMPTVGHDAAMFARLGIPASVLLVRNAHGSHNPHEHLEMADFAEGLRVLTASTAALLEARPA